MAEIAKKTELEVVPTDTEMLSLPGDQAVDISKPEGAATALTALRQYREWLNSAENRCRETLRAEADRLGLRTFDVYGTKVEVATQESSVEYVYDVALLHDGLVEKGLPADRVADLISYEPKVNGTVVRQLRRQPEYREVIDRAILSMKQKPRTVRFPT